MCKDAQTFVAAVTSDTAVMAGLDLQAGHFRLGSSQDSFAEAMAPRVKPGGDIWDEGRAS